MAFALGCAGGDFRRRVGRERPLPPVGWRRTSVPSTPAVTFATGWTGGDLRDRVGRLVNLGTEYACCGLRHEEARR
ncbi:hypothetical protein DUI70_4157 [Streptomyces albus]|nr:hypothetical protein DUI70_4157 [Streptomyces albus]